jgi:hypothetical protein
VGRPGPTAVAGENAISRSLKTEILRKDVAARKQDRKMASSSSIALVGSQFEITGTK